MEQWASGQELDQRHQAKALLLGEFADLEWADYAAFYVEYDGSIAAPEETESDPQ